MYKTNIKHEKCHESGESKIIQGENKIIQGENKIIQGENNIIQGENNIIQISIFFSHNINEKGCKKGPKCVTMHKVVTCG
jgi:hypothetical protein